jgi:hypothetical protein
LLSPHLQVVTFLTGISFEKEKCVEFHQSLAPHFFQCRQNNRLKDRINSSLIGSKQEKNGKQLAAALSSPQKNGRNFILSECFIATYFSSQKFELGFEE